MPTYEYRCPTGHEFERFYRSISAAEPVVKCPACGAVAERRMSAGAGLLFKGSGFYITDYGKDGKKDQRAPAKPDGAKPDPGATGSNGTGAGASDAGGSDAGGSDAGGKPAEAKPAAESKPAAPPKSTGSSE